jgi:glycosyltransferase involved in cell wall biosynthesis
MIFAPRDLSIALVDGLVAKGHTVTFATTPDVPTRATILPGDIALLALLDRTMGTGEITDLPTVRMIDAIRRDYEIDLLIRAIHEVKSGAYDLVHLYQKDLAHYFDDFFRPTPTVYTLHDSVPERDTLAYALYDNFKNHRYIAISNAQRQTYEGFHVVGMAYHGIDTRVFPVGKGGSGFIWLGRLVPEKGVEDAIKACVIANERLGIGSQFPGPQEASPYYRTSVAPYLDDPKIEKIGMVTTRRRAELLGRAKALLFPIKWEEPFGLVMIEAMACGTPVIAYNRGSVQEVVKDGVTGFIIEPSLDHAEVVPLSGTPRTTTGPPASQAHPKTSWIIKKRGVPGLVEAIGRIGEINRAACRKHVEKYFNVEKMVNGYEEVYKKILQEK